MTQRMDHRLQWVIEERGDMTAVRLVGRVDEDVDFSTLTAQIGSRGWVRFDLSAVERFNSCGVREWVNFMRSIGTIQRFEFEKCSPSVVGQLNMIRNFRGSAQIISALAPMVCETCGAEQLLEVAIERGKRPVVSKPQCAQCNAPMVLDDSESWYFAFAL